MNEAYLADVQSIDVMRSPDGRDVALCVSQGTGQTLLTFDQ